MTKIKVLNLKDSIGLRLSGDVVFYLCNPEGPDVAEYTTDFSKNVFSYINENIKPFNAYAKKYIEENGTDVRITQSMLFEFKVHGFYQNNALELIAIKKTIDALNCAAITLVVPDEYNQELLRTALDDNYRFKIKKTWLFRFILRNLFYFLCFLPMSRLKKLLQGAPTEGNIVFHSFITSDLRTVYRIDPYLGQLADGLKKHGLKINRFISFGDMKVASLIKSLWQLDASEFIFPEAFLSLKEIWKSFIYCLSIRKNEDLTVFLYDRHDLTSYMKALSLYLAIRCLNFRFDLMRKYMRKLGSNYRAIVIQHEGYFYQRALFEESVLNKKKKLRIAYQSATVSAYLPNSYYGIFHKRYDPDVIFTSGKFFSKYLTGRLEYPERMIKVGCPLNNIPQGRLYQRSTKPILCVYVDLYYTEAMAIKKYMEGTLLNGAFDFDVGIRFHPYIPKDLISLFRNIIHFEYSSADESLTKSDCFLSAGISTINLSAALTGKPVYLLDIPNMPRWFDCYYMDNIKYIKPNEPVPVDFFSEKESINEDTGVSLDETCEEIIRLMSDRKTNGCHTKQEYGGVDGSYSPPPFQTII